MQLTDWLLLVLTSVWLVDQWSLNAEWVLLSRGTRVARSKITLAIVQIGTTRTNLFIDVLIGRRCGQVALVRSSVKWGWAIAICVYATELLTYSASDLKFTLKQF